VLAEAIAAEVGDGVTVVQLHTGSLGEPGSGAETLIGMLTSNAQRIAETLT
jgi:ABC-type Zn uptake system ZnuABC Zn-binding protein ZnuA